MKRIDIDLRRARSGHTGVVPWAAAAAALLLALAFTLYNADAYLRNASLLDTVSRRVAALEKEFPGQLGPALVEGEARALRKKIEFINDYAGRRDFSWTALLSGLESSMPDGVYLVRISPEFKSSTVTVTGAARGMARVLSTVDGMGRGGFEEVFLLSHSEDEKTGLIMFTVRARYRAVGA